MSDVHEPLGVFRHPLAYSSGRRRPSRPSSRRSSDRFDRVCCASSAGGRGDRRLQSSGSLSVGWIAENLLDCPAKLGRSRGFPVERQAYPEFLNAGRDSALVRPAMRTEGSGLRAG